MNAETTQRPTPDQRHEMIAIAAYYLAECRNFAPGGAETDWLKAERAIDAMIADRRITGVTDRESGRRIIRNALVFHAEHPDEPCPP